MILNRLCVYFYLLIHLFIHNSMRDFIGFQYLLSLSFSYTEIRLKWIQVLGSMKVLGSFTRILLNVFRHPIRPNYRWLLNVFGKQRIKRQFCISKVSRLRNWMHFAGACIVGGCVCRSLIREQTCNKIYKETSWALNILMIFSKIALLTQSQILFTLPIYTKIFCNLL